MSPKQRLVYWDTSVFISLIDDPEGVPEKIDQQRISKGLFEDARKGAFALITSAFTRAEIRRDRGQPPLSSEEMLRAGKLFEYPSIRLVSVDRIIAEMAADFGGRFNLNPGDAVQLATAVHVKADVLMAWDGNFHRPVAMAGAPIKIEYPTWTGDAQLPLFEPGTTPVPQLTQQPAERPSDEGEGSDDQAK